MATFSLYNYTGSNYRSWYSINDGAKVTYSLTLNNQNLDSITMIFGNPDAKISSSLSKYIYWEISGADSDSGSFTIGSLSNNSSWTAGSTYSKTIYPNITATSGTIYLTLSSSYRATSENTGLACYGSNWSASTSSAYPDKTAIITFSGGILSTASLPSANPLSITMTYISSRSRYEGTISWKIASASGYTFTGWSPYNNNSPYYTSGDTMTFFADPNDFNSSGYVYSTLYACWSANSYTITYNYNGGSGTDTSKTVTFGNSYGELPTPTKIGYSFKGWYTSASGGSRILASTTVTTASNHTIYAQWTISQYNLTYNGNGGLLEDGSTTLVEKMDYGTLLDFVDPIDSKGFSRTGYKFIGWNTDKDAVEILPNYTITDSNFQELFAIWELMSNIRVYTNENWQIAIPYVYENGEWKLSISKVFNNEKWRQ